MSILLGLATIFVGISHVTFEELQVMNEAFAVPVGLGALLLMFALYIYTRGPLRSAFAITETELALMAALAIMGLSSSPNTG